MGEKRMMAVVAKFFTFKEAAENDNIYFSSMSAEDLLRECFELRRLNYFGNAKKQLPRIEKVARIVKRQVDGEDNA